MSTNGANTVEDADMSECDGEKVVTMMDVLQEQQEFEEDANAVLGASDDKNCTYSKGYIKRQAIYACLTCCVEAKNDPTKRAGVCLACSLNCHENHELIELYTKRNFRCDCGNPKFNSHPCQFTPNKTDLNEDNSYNQNFSGLYCTCHRPYPDPECPVEDEMIQCIICEDWLHASHLEASIPANELYSEMICKACMDNNEFLHDYSNLAVNVETADVDILTVNGTDTGTDDKITCNGDLEKNRFINGTAELFELTKEIKAKNSMDIDMNKDKLEENEDMCKLDTAVGNDNLVKNDEVEVTKEEKEEVVETKIIHPESSIDGNKKENNLENIDAKQVNSAKILTNYQENIHKESIESSIEVNELEKTVTEKHSTAETVNTDKNIEPKVTEKSMDTIFESEVSQNITNSIVHEKEVPESEENKLLDMSEYSVISENTQSISQTNLDLVLEESSKSGDDKTTAKLTETSENSLHVKADTTSSEDKTNNQSNTEQKKVGIEDTKARGTDQSIDGTDCPAMEDDQTKNTRLSNTDTSEIDNLLEENVEKTIAEPSPKSETEVEFKHTVVNIVPEQNLLEADKLENENIDETDRSETTADKTEELSYDNTQDKSNEETVEKAQEPEPLNDAETNVDTENKNNDVSNNIEMNDSGNQIANKDKVLSDKTEDTEMDGITNKIDNESAVTNRDDPSNYIETKSDIKMNDITSEFVPNDNDNNDICINIESQSKSTPNTEINVDSSIIKESTNSENKVPNVSVVSEEENIKENKRKLSTEDAEDMFVKKPKLEETNKCIRPKGVKKVFKGATFWPSNFRQKLCTCNECISMYKDMAVLYLIDLEDTVFAYETLGKEKINGGPASQYEKGLQALSSLDRIQQINALTEYNKMRDKLLDFLKSFKDRKEIVKEEDIKAFFAGMKPKREPDGVYFCR